MIKELETNLNNFDTEKAREFSLNCVDTYFDIMSPVWNAYINTTKNALKMWGAYLNAFGVKA